jgi:hypothetical protein
VTEKNNKAIMNIESINRRKDAGQNQKLAKAYSKFEGLREALNIKNLPESNIAEINEDIHRVNTFLGSEKELIKLLKKTYTAILAYVGKELNLVSKIHYQQLWMVYGMFAGILVSTISFNFFQTDFWSLQALGLPMGMLFGLLAGRNRDIKAKNDGLQLNV